MNTIVSASLLSADTLNLGNELERIKSSGCDQVHFDVMDGVFVNNLSFGLPVLRGVRSGTALPVDVHLMITEPRRYIDAFADAGADMISFHLEAQGDPNEVNEIIDCIKKRGKLAGVAIKPDTPVEMVLPYLSRADYVLEMTVEPGFGGQGFIYDTLEKIAALKAFIRSNSLDVLIQVDGGINDKTAGLAVNAGADILVAGSYLFGNDMAAAAAKLSAGG